MQAAGATIVDIDAAGATFPFPDGGFLTLLYDFKVDTAAYFATRVGVPVAGGTIADVDAFNLAHADVEMPFFGQEIFDIEADIDVSSPDAPQLDFDGMTYNQALDGSAAFGANVDQILADNDLDAIVAPTGDLAWATDLYYTDRFTFGSSFIAAIGGYPNVQVPASTVFGLPFGVSFIGTAFSEPTLIKLASGFEAVTQARVEPTFSPTILADHTKGVPLNRKQRGRHLQLHHRPI